MSRFRNPILTGISLVVLFAVGTMTNPRTGYSSPGGLPAAPTQTQNVNVVNTPAVVAQQAGAWNVGISGTPSVAIDTSNNTVKLDSNNNTVKVDSAAPVIVRDIDNPARQPVAASCQQQAPQSPCMLITVPPNRMLVIEMFQGNELDFVTNGQFQALTFAQPSQLVRVYADPQSTVMAFCNGIGPGKCTITGYLVNV